MKIKLPVLALYFMLIGRLVPAQGPAFTYQGTLNDAGAPANGSYDLRFAIYAAASAGSPQASLLTNAATAVSNGRFTVTLDFGAGVFSGADRWLEIAVRTNGGADFTPLAPRQPITNCWQTCQPRSKRQA